MRASRFLTLSFAVWLGAHGLAEPRRQRVSSEAASARAVWVLRTSLGSPESVRAMIDRVSAAGFDTVLLQVRGRGEAYYRSRLEPPAPELLARPGFDPLALAIELGHAAGLSVHAWVNVNLVSSAAALPRSAGHVVGRHPEWLMVPQALARDLSAIDPASPAYVATLARWTRREAASVEGLYLSPITVAAQDYSVALIEELAGSYALDGVHLDYVRYPNDAFDFSPAALAEFRVSRLSFSTTDERERLDAAAESDPLAWTAYLPDSWAEFRRARLTALVDRIGQAARRTRPGSLISAAVVPSVAEAREGRLQDWAGWVRGGLLDVVCPMAYTDDAGVFERQVLAIRDEVPGATIWAGVGAYRLSASAASRHVRLARQAGANGVALFSYDSVAAGRDGGRRYFASLKPALLEDVPRPPTR